MMYVSMKVNLNLDIFVAKNLITSKSKYKISWVIEHIV